MNELQKINIDNILPRADNLVKEGKDFIMSEGKVLKITEWLTIAEYAQKYYITTQVVSK